MSMHTNPKLWWYYLPSESGEGWAMIVIGDNGFFSAVSDYGNYGYLWTNHGMDDVRKFFLKAHQEWDYFLRKLGPAKTYDSEKTYKAISECILDGRRHGGWDRERARKEYDRLREAGVRDGGQVEFYLWYQDTSIGDASELGKYSPCPQAVAFCQKTLPRLAKLLKAELESEKKGISV